MSGLHAMMTLASVEESGAVVLFGGMFAVAIVAVVTDAVQKMHRTKARELSRREIAAYVAEGSISPDDAAKLIAAGNSLNEIKDAIKNKIKG